MKLPPTIRLGRSILVAAFFLLPAAGCATHAALADQPIDGCYHNDALMPWLDAVTCTHGNVDTDNHPTPVVHTRQPEPPHDCPYDKKGPVR